MPFPMNFIDREFAEQTRQPAASFARALAEMYEAFALIEERAFPSAEAHFRAAAEKLTTTIVQMEALPFVDDRWTVRDSPAFPALLSQLADAMGVVPVGDRSVIDHLVGELRVLRGAIEVYGGPGGEAPIPRGGEAPAPKSIPGEPEAQADMIRGILAHALRLQRVGLLATQISTVT